MMRDALLNQDARRLGGDGLRGGPEHEEGVGRDGQYEQQGECSHLHGSAWLPIMAAEHP